MLYVALPTCHLDAAAASLRSSLDQDDLLGFVSVWEYEDGEVAAAGGGSQTTTWKSVSDDRSGEEAAGARQRETIYLSIIIGMVAVGLITLAYCCCGKAGKNSDTADDEQAEGAEEETDAAMQSIPDPPSRDMALEA